LSEEAKINVITFTCLNVAGLDLQDGGHISHGLMTQKKRLSAASIFFETLPYHVDTQTGLIDYQELETSAKNFKPDVIIAGLYKLCEEIAGFLLFLTNRHFSRCYLVSTDIGL